MFKSKASVVSVSKKERIGLRRIDLGLRLFLAVGGLRLNCFN